VPGMNSGLSPSDPVLVAAFRPALLHQGAIAPTAGTAAAGQWSVLATLRALAASAQGRRCGLTGVNAVSFGAHENPMAAGSCVRPGVAGVFTDADGTWRSAGLVLPGRGPGMGTVQVLGLAAAAGGNTVPVQYGSSD
jgi:hypothetical protein